MGVFTFVCRSSGDEWSAKQLKGDVEASAGSTFELQRKLVQAALSCDSSGGVQSSFSFVTPSSAVFQVPPISLFISPLISLDLCWVYEVYCIKQVVWLLDQNDDLGCP